jgi:3-hydroxyacyl-[acyl-carrier-protein] dehydratase
MLMNNLYTLRLMESAPDGSAIRSEIMLNSRHPLFKGHFPENPILPGVCTVDIIRELLELSIRKPLKMVRAGSIKYLGFVNPEMMPLLEFRFQLNYVEDSTISCSVVVSAQDKAVCSFKGTFHS